MTLGMRTTAYAYHSVEVILVQDQNFTNASSAIKRIWLIWKPESQRIAVIQYYACLHRNKVTTQSLVKVVSLLLNDTEDTGRIEVLGPMVTIIGSM